MITINFIKIYVFFTSIMKVRNEDTSLKGSKGMADRKEIRQMSILKLFWYYYLSSHGSRHWSSPIIRHLLQIAYNLFLFLLHAIKFNSFFGKDYDIKKLQLIFYLSLLSAYLSPDIVATTALYVLVLLVSLSRKSTITGYNIRVTRLWLDQVPFVICLGIEKYPFAFFDLTIWVQHWYQISLWYIRGGPNPNSWYNLRHCS